MNVARQLDLSNIKRLGRIQKTLAGWAVEGQQIGGDDLKRVVDRLNGDGYEEAPAIPRTFVLAQGANGAVQLVDGSETYLYWA